MTTNSSRGFTLVETMVAISVLAIALVGPYIAVTNALRGSYTARDQLIASQLAQEGMEYIRSIRDNNYLNGRSWLDGFSNAARDNCYNPTPGGGVSGVCTLDPILGDFHQTQAAMVEYTSASAAPTLNLNTARLYTQQTGSGFTPTSFKRTVQIATISATEVRVTMTVSWVTLGQTYSVVITNNLRDWL